MVARSMVSRGIGRCDRGIRSPCVSYVCVAVSLVLFCTRKGTRNLLYLCKGREEKERKC